MIFYINNGWGEAHFEAFVRSIRRQAERDNCRAVFERGVDES
jgi:hypothetical protein